MTTVTTVTTVTEVTTVTTIHTVKAVTTVTTYKGSAYLSSKRDQVMMRDYMDRGGYHTYLVSWVTSLPSKKALRPNFAKTRLIEEKMLGAV